MYAEYEDQPVFPTEFGFIVVVLDHRSIIFGFIQDRLRLLDLLRCGKQVSAAKSHQILVD